MCRNLLKSAGLLLVTLLLAGSADAGPALFWASDPIGPDDTILFTGAELQTIQSVKLRRQSDKPDAAPGQNEQAFEAEVVQLRANSLKAVIPAIMASGVYDFELIGPSGPVAKMVNAPTIYWTQGDGGASAAPGGWVRVFGRNIRRTDGALLELTTSAGQKLRLTSDSGDLWSARFAIPMDLATGTYKLRLWNGNGDSSSWRDAGELAVRSSNVIPDHQESIAAFMPSGGNSLDDTQALLAAIASVAKNGGGTVLLPRGYYNLSASIVLPPKVRLKGDGAGLTSLVWADSSTPPPVLIEGSSNFAVEDLTISAGRHFHVIRGGFPTVASAKDGENITIRGVRIRAMAFLGRISMAEAEGRANTLRTFEPNGVDSIALAGRNLVVENCDVVGSQRALLLLRPVNARISGNTLGNGRGGWYSISGPNGVIFENNVIVGRDLQATGGGINSLLAGTAYSQNVLFQNNRLESMYGWDREAMTTDGPGGFYYGGIEAQSGRVLVLEGVPSGVGLGRTPPSDWAGAGVLVVRGKGWGEYGRLIAHAGRKITLDRDLPVPLDGSSSVVIVPMQTHYLIIGNTFSDARVAIQLFGTAIDHVISGNTSFRTSGFIGRGMVYKHVQPNWYNQFLDNTIAEADPAAPSSLAIWGTQTEPNKAVLNYATVVRGNKLRGNGAIDLRGADVRAPGLSDIVLEHNSIARTDVGIKMDRAVKNVLIRANEFSDVKRHFGR